MLTRIEIDGFKTFADFAIDLGPCTVLLGANGVGKSNLLDAIELLAQLATREVAEAVALRGAPLALFRHTPAGRSPRIRLAAEVLVDPQVRDPWGNEGTLSHTRLRYELTLERRERCPGVDCVQVLREAVMPIPRRRDRWAAAARGSPALRARPLQYGRRTPLLSTEDGAEGSAFRIHADGGPDRRLPAHAAGMTVLGSVRSAEYPHLYALREAMRHWRRLQPEPSRMRDPVPVGAPDQLTADGANLAAVLATLKAETASPTQPLGVLGDIAAALGQLIPEVAALDVERGAGRGAFQLSLSLRDGQSVTAAALSDGTLRLLALLTLLHDPRQRGLVCIEEPERQVYPHVLGLLGEQLRDHTLRGGQVLSCTHSTDFLNAAALDEVCVLSRRDGPTRLRRASEDPQIRAYLDAGDSLGPLWRQGFLDEAG